jgi:hypothetical protein
MQHKVWTFCYSEIRNGDCIDVAADVLHELGLAGEKRHSGS